jgi:hypothetical protein
MSSLPQSLDSPQSQAPTSQAPQQPTGSEPVKFAPLPTGAPTIAGAPQFLNNAAGSTPAATNPETPISQPHIPAGIGEQQSNGQSSNSMPVKFSPPPTGGPVIPGAPRLSPQQASPSSGLPHLPTNEEIFKKDLFGKGPGEGDNHDKLKHQQFLDDAARSQAEIDKKVASMKAAADQATKSAIKKDQLDDMRWPTRRV